MRPRSGTETLSDGVATFSTSSLAVGSNSITADYQGDPNYTTSTASAVTVTVASTSTSTTTLTFSPSTSVYGQSVTLTATVVAVTSGAGTPTGTVKFFIGTTLLGTGTLSNGVATLATTALPAGNDSITAEYSGDSTFTSSTSTAVTVPVTQASTTTTVTFTPSTSVYGQSVTLTATIAAISPGGGTPTGTVEFLNGGTSLGHRDLERRRGDAAITSLPAGNDSITAEYQGDTNFLDEHVVKRHGARHPGIDHHHRYLLPRLAGFGPDRDADGDGGGGQPGRRHAHRDGRVPQQWRPRSVPAP